MPRSLGEWLAHQAGAHPTAIDMGLGRLSRVLERLAWRQPRVPVITVAGTNGKGSVTAYCASILTAAGYRVGVFTSPHLRDYRERIRVAGRLVSEEELVTAFERIEAACQGGERISLTFFEYNALAAYLIFDAAELDAWVLEVGMGGRLDAVNIVDATVAVVVSIGLDHQEFLGDTLEAIAGEKAGIFRAGRAAVLGNAEMPAVLESIAAERGAVVKRRGHEFDYGRAPGGWHFRGTRWDIQHLPPPALAGDIQFANAATALAALEELPAEVVITAAAVARGLTTVRLVGRFQRVMSPGRPEWILDVAHNPDAARVLRDNLQALPPCGRTLAVCGILLDKDAPAIVREVRGCFDGWWLASTPGSRGSSALELARRVAGQLTVPVIGADDIGAACAGAAAAAAAATDRIVVFGSFHTVGPALDWLESQGLLQPEVPEYTLAPLVQ